uniref:LOB domain-containing protein n=1 Tax=Kalanchoe fedtschenkoi TaxID=63787 RepID=A0A7N0SXG6_KALFE
MSCNGCRALRKGCGDSCVLRPSLQWIAGHQAQVHATLFAAKFFGRSDLIGFLSAVPHDRKPALFQSLLFEACGRTINPVSGAVGLLSAGNWHLCQAAVDGVLSGRTPQPLQESTTPTRTTLNNTSSKTEGIERMRSANNASSFTGSELLFSGNFHNQDSGGRGGKILNLFI